MIKGLTLTLALLFAGAIIFVNSQAAANTNSTQKKSATKPSINDGKTLYMQNCARCHGGDGRAETAQGELYGATNLADADWWNAKHPSNKRLTNSIVNGRSGMPAFGKRLSKDQIAALVAYVRTFRGK